MVNRKTWEEFRAAGLLWWVNTILHTLGWAIVFDMDGDKVIEVYPARVKFRGFDEKSNSEGYIRVSRYIAQNANELAQEAEE